MIQKSNTVEFSREFYNIFKSLTFTKCVLGKNLVFRKVDDKVVCGRFDEESKNVYFYLIMDEYSFKFPEENITFNDFALFLDCCRRQGFTKDSSFKIRRVLDRKNFDVVEIHNTKTAISYRLYDPNAYPDEMGFLEELDPDNLDPEMFSFELSSDEISEITELCTSKHFECETFNISKKKDCIILRFNGLKDMEYKVRIASDRISNFDNITVGEEVKFSFNSFQLMSQVGVGYKISLLNENDNYNILSYAEINVDNQQIKSYLFSPSRISND